MAEETNDGAAYLAALRASVVPSSGPGAAAAVSQSAQGAGSGTAANSNAATPYTGAEKRRSPRYKCEGSVEMQEEGCDVRTWASFTDISLHGCYVEAQATYPIGTALHMKLEANGFKVETKGTVRVNYPYLGMGIAFVDMSAENRAQLKDLLGSISRPSVIIGPGVHPTAAPLEAVPPVSDPQAAIEALVEFFKSRQTLMRDEFLKILRTSQSLKATR